MEKHEQRKLEKRWREDKKNLISEIHNSIEKLNEPGVRYGMYFHFCAGGAKYWIKTNKLALKAFLKRVKLLYPTTIKQLNKTFTDNQLFPKY